MSSIPELQNLNIVGGMIYPQFDPGKNDYYVQLEKDWNEQLTVKLWLH